MTTKSRKLIPVREPSGRPSRAQDDPGRDYAPTEVRRLRDAAMRGLRDAEWGSELGGLFLERKITAAMYGVGKWWRDMAFRYRSAIDAPWPVPRTAAMELGARGSGAEPDTDEGRRQAARDRNAVEQFREASAILTAAGTLAAHHVRELCEGDCRPFGFIAMRATCAGLQKLADWRDLTIRAKNANGR